MSIKDGGRYEITVDGPCVTIKEPCGFSGEYHRSEYADNVLYGAIRQQARDLEQLRTDLAAAVSENAALLAANRDLKVHFDALKGDYDEAAHFARHFIRDDAAITPRGAIIRLGDKCTSLFSRMKIAETERDEWIACHAQLYRKLGSLLAVIHRDGGHYESEHGTEKACADAETAVHVMRGCVDGFISSANEWRQRAEQAEARLAAIDSAPVVHCAWVVINGVNTYAQLIARPAKDSQSAFEETARSVGIRFDDIENHEDKP